MSGYRLASSVPLDEGQVNRLRAIDPQVEIRSGWAMAPDEFRTLLDARTDIVYSFRLPDDLIELAPDLQWIQLLSAGSEHLEGNPVRQTRIRVTTVSGVHATPIAEYVLATILALYRQLPRAYRAQMRREWIDQNEFTRTSRELRGRTVGILGYGAIGREVARLMQPFGVTIYAMKRDPDIRTASGYTVPGTGDPDGRLPDEFFGPDGLYDLLARSDVVVVALPSTPDTRGLLDASAFDAMKSGSYLINIARGDIMDEGALIAALKAKTLAGAALDVFEEEPLPKESELWGLENVIATPHISGASRPYLRRCFEVLAENFRRFVEGEPLLNQVDLTRGY